MRGAEYASYPRGAGTTACPFCSEITRYEWPLVRLPFRIGVVLAFVPAVAALALGRGGTSTRRRPQRRLDICLAVLLVAAVMLFLEDAVLTELKFSGNGRYLFPAACLTIVVGMVGWARFAAWGVRGRCRGSSRRAVGWVAVAVVTAVAIVAIVPSAVDAFAKLKPTWSALRFQADVRRDLTTAVARAGGAARLKACGAVQTNTQLVPLVAWTLHETIAAAEATHWARHHPGPRDRNLRAVPVDPVDPAQPRLARGREGRHGRDRHAMLSHRLGSQLSLAHARRTRRR